ncbi:MAG: hypothetical protein ACON4E_07710 [Flavobacteriales bacterium]
MNKKITTLLALFFVQFIISSCEDTCVCPPPSVFEKHYTSIHVDAFDTSGFEPTLVSESVYKNAFGLSFYAQSEYRRIAKIFQRNASFGFNSSFACSCLGDEYRNNDTIEQINIYAINMSNEELLDASDWFTVSSYNGSSLTLAEHMDLYPIYGDGFQLDLDTISIVPDSVVFKVDFSFTSGLILSNQTATITFIQS